MDGRCPGMVDGGGLGGAALEGEGEGVESLVATGVSEVGAQTAARVDAIARSARGRGVAQMLGRSIDECQKPPPGGGFWLVAPTGFEPALPP